MNPGSDAAGQVVRMSLDGIEVAARVTGAGAKHTALIIAATLKENQKTMGKARLTSMLKSGKELKVYTIDGSQLKTFTREARRYGVLYCVLKPDIKDISNSDIDIMVKAEDASKISRILERMTLVTEAATVNPQEARLDRSPLSSPSFEGGQERASERRRKMRSTISRNKPSLLAKLRELDKAEQIRDAERAKSRGAETMWNSAIAMAIGGSKTLSQSKDLHLDKAISRKEMDR